MRVDVLELKGFLRFLDPVRLDLTAVPSGLIAVTGENGAGKTTLLEAVPAALYRTFLSRGDLVDYATGRDSYVDVQLTVEGRGRYRARVNVDGVKRASDAVLEQELADGTRVRVNDGRVSTYDTAVGGHFPTKELLLASAFAAQNKAGSFIALDRKARKGLFMRLLGIERYDAMSATARQAATLVDETRAQIASRGEEAGRTASDAVREALDTEDARLQAVARQAGVERQECHQARERLRIRLAALGTELEAAAAAQSRVATLRAEREARRLEQDALETERQRIQADTDRERAALEARRRADLAAIADEVQRTDAAAERERAEIETARAREVEECRTRIAGNEQIRAKAADIRDAVRRLSALEVEVGALEGAQIADRATASEHRRQLAAWDVRAEQLRRQVAEQTRASDDAALLHVVPCAGAPAYAGCQFLAQATAAAAELPTLTRQIDETRAELDPAVAAGRHALALVERTLADRTLQLEACAQTRAGLLRLTRHADALAAADARIAELTERQQKADEDAARARQAVEVRHAARLQELLVRESASEQACERGVEAAVARQRTREQDRLERLRVLAGVIDRLEGALAAAERDVAGLALAQQQAAEAQGAMAEAQMAWDALTGRLATIAAEQQALARRQTEWTQARARHVELRARVERLTEELLEWQLLAKAFGREGLPVLEIDAAGPTVSALTNDLLAACFGTRFSVDLVTQQPKADGSGLKEAFTVAVTDNTDGSARDIGDLSGGEQVIVAEALMAGIAIYVNQRSPTPVRTCWRDETTGALDTENAQRYVAMLRRCHELGGFNHTWFISHNPDVAACADVQIQVRPYGVAIVYPPFVAAVEGP